MSKKDEITEKSIDNYELNLIINVVKKYYKMGMTQDQIAKEEFISKSTVSRLLKKATERGIVNFQINYPVDSVEDFEGEFHKYFDINHVLIAPTLADDYETRLKDTCRMAASDLCKIIQPEDYLGIGWGLTMEQLTDILTQEYLIKKKCSKVIMIDGSIASEVDSIKSSYIIKELADFFSADGFLFPVPMVVDSKETAEILRNDSHIKYVMDFIKQVRIAIFGIGYASNESVLRRRGAYSKEDYDDVLTLGAVGDILGHCFDIHGKPVSGRLDGCITGIDLPTLKEREYRIGIAVGNQKVKAIIGALRGKYVSRLYTDSETAREVIRLMKIH
ncbi:MAG: winged helix-turn-helix transcriptional regulator [Clostridiales Family XIII bacterium]|nr:winged helix-turn-helix transcriptional regulator [Clostridiales Family XIII bacterium]